MFNYDKIKKPIPDECPVMLEHAKVHLENTLTKTEASRGNVK